MSWFPSPIAGWYREDVGSVVVAIKQTAGFPHEVKEMNNGE